jgi:hypothetical protein
VLATKIDQFMKIIVKTSRDNHGRIVDPSHYEFNGACSIELFRPEGWNPNKLAVTARDTALNIFLPL